ncbi:F0F1 ATP synthase subunit A [Candidatus Saccharibacteria bacterium]|nr:MAG: F0F1 ATP synthase subunit A [Candidatus Saccharibacteria bacterium]
MEIPPIHLPASTLFHVGPLPITNTMILGGLGVVLMLAILIAAALQVKAGKSNRFTGFVQWVFEGMYGNIYTIIPDKKIAASIAPLALTIFFTVLCTYWVSIIPGVGSVKLNGHELLRGLPTDLNFTTALAFVTMTAVQVYAIKHHGFFKNIGRYLINPLKDPIGSFEGLLEIVGEASRLLALSFRLFGNAFAGEVLLMIVGALSGYFASLSLPLFMAFELFIGFIQAYVFYMLTLIFAALATMSHGGHTSPDHSSAPIPVGAMD